MRFGLGELWQMLNVFQILSSVEEERCGKMKQRCEGLPVTVEACSWGVVVDVDVAMWMGPFNGSYALMARRWTAILRGLVND